MNKKWLEGIKDADKERHIQDLHQSKRTRNKLNKILKKKLESNQQAARSVAAYTEENWAYRQADRIGYERALAEIIKLIDF